MAHHPTWRGATGWILLGALFVAALSAAGALLRPAHGGIAPSLPVFQDSWKTRGGVYYAVLDSLGNLFVAEPGSHSIAKYDARGHLLLRWGSNGTGDGQFSSPIGVAVDHTGHVYVADFFNDRVQKFTGEGVFVTKWGVPGTLPGQFDHPEAIAIDASGNVYVTEWDGHRVQKFTPSGVYMAQWGGQGSLPGQFQNPDGIAVDRASDVYVVDAGNHRIQVFDSAGNFLRQWGSMGVSPGQFNVPAGIGVDRWSNVYVSEWLNHRVQKFTSAGAPIGHWGTLGGSDGSFNGPYGISMDPSDHLYIVDHLNARIQKFSAGGPVSPESPSAAVVHSWNPQGGGTDHLFGAATDSVGNLFVVNFGSHGVHKFSNSGTQLNYRGGAIGTGDGFFNFPTYVAVGRDGFVYVSDTFNNRIQKFDGTLGYVSQWAATNPEGIAIGPDGDVWQASPQLNAVIRWSSTGSSKGFFDSGVGKPRALAFDDAGLLYVLDEQNDRVLVFSVNPNGFQIDLVRSWGSSGSAPGQFLQPRAIAIDADGNVWVTDEDADRVQKFSSTGALLATFGPTFADGQSLQFPSGAAFDPGGNLFLSDGATMRKLARAPEILQIADIANDQGKLVRLRFRRSSAEYAGGTGVFVYSIYRRVEPLPGSADALGSVVHAAAPSPNEVASPVLVGWDIVGSASATGAEAYTVTVPTLADANSASIYHSEFLVQANTLLPLTFLNSRSELGYSVDNIAPPTPSPFTGAYVDNNTHLHWGVNTAPDYAGFRLYRETDPGYVPGPANLIAVTTDTGYVDPGPAGRYYKLTAVDFNGNESAPALVGPGQTTDAEPALVFALHGVWPNPATSRDLVVRFVLPAAASARLELFDIAGRRVAMHEVNEPAAGAHAVRLAARTRLGPGLYFLRLQQEDDVATARVTVVD